MVPARRELLTDLLKSVSRSFYTTLRVLPGAIRPQIGLAYLLARATDTIADTDIVPVTKRLEALEALRARVLGARTTPLDFGEFASTAVPGGSSEAEQCLLSRIEEAIAVLGVFSADDRQSIREVISVITGGQALDLRRFGGARPAETGGTAEVRALDSDQDLDDYAYRVAGCVGEFWTRMCRRHLFPSAPLDDAFLMSHGVRFGKGLQLVNILRDLPRDLRMGRCYLPARRLAQAGLAPAELLDPSNEPRVRPLYNEWLGRAEDHLAAGWAYANALPRGSVRVRLACAWPILIGARTLALLRSGAVLDPSSRIKISRRQVRQIILRSVVLYPFPEAWSGLLALPGRSAR